MKHANFIKRPNGDGLFFENIDTIIYNDEYISRIGKDTFLYNVLRNAVQNGVFMRNTSCKISRNYWIPLSNAGLPSVKKKTHLHESTFFFHDIMHNNFNDLTLLSTSDEFDFSIYIIHRVAGEAITLALTDWLFIDSIYDTLTQSEKEHIEEKKLYNAYVSIKDVLSFNDIIKAHIRFAVLGDRSGFEVDGIIPEKMIEYLDWFEPVYVSDLVWTEANARYIMDKSSLEFDDYIYRNKYKFWSIERFKKENGITNIDNKETVMVKICNYYLSRLEFVRGMGERNVLSSEEITTRAIKNFIVYQSKIVFDFNFDGIQTKEYLSEIQSLAYGRNLKQSDVDKHLKSYNMLHRQICSMGKIKDRDKELYSQVYPFFTYKNVSYNTEDMKDTLVNISNKLIKIK